MPSGAQVQSGNVVINSSEINHLKIDQKTNKSVINWNSFSIHKEDGLISTCLHPLHPH